MKFILASSSPRRRELLLRLQTPFDIILPDVDESIIPPDGSPETYCTALAELKANDISQHYPNNLVIGSDTIVVLDNNIMGKPEDKAMAQKMLETLSGKKARLMAPFSSTAAIVLTLGMRLISIGLMRSPLVAGFIRMASPGEPCLGAWTRRQITGVFSLPLTASNYK